MIHYARHGVVVRDAVEADIAALGGRLRDADEKEVIAAGNKNGEDSLRQSYARSAMCFSVDIDGLTVAMFGCVCCSVLAGEANVWFLGAPELARIKKTFVRLSRHFIAKFLIQFRVIWNHVDARYESSISWLKACGAEFRDEPIILNGQPFYTFVIRRA